MTVGRGFKVGLCGMQTVVGVALSGCARAPEAPAFDTGEQLGGTQTRRLTVDGRPYLAEWKDNFQWLESPAGSGEGFQPLVSISRGDGTQFDETPRSKAEARRVASAFCDTLGYQPYDAGLNASARFAQAYPPYVSREGGTPHTKPGNNAEWVFGGICAPEGYR